MTTWFNPAIKAAGDLAYRRRMRQRRTEYFRKYWRLGLISTAAFVGSFALVAWKVF